MLSRVADSIYWMNRYVERAENVARFVDVNHYLTLDLPDDDATAWRPVVATTGDDTAFRERYGEATRENALRFLVFDREYPSSVVSCLGAARENARSVREVISTEMWEVVNRAYLAVRGADPARVIEAPHEFLAEVKQASQLFVGTTYLTMTHNEGWHFGRLARLLERADKTSRIIDVRCFALQQRGRLDASSEEILWAALLKSASSFEMYRKRHGRITPREVMAFLLFAPQFPRSVYYCVRKAERSLHAIIAAQGKVRDPVSMMPPPPLVPQSQWQSQSMGGQRQSMGPWGSNLAVERIESLRTDIERATVEEILAIGLHEFLDTVQTRLNSVGDGVYRSFIALDSP